MKTLLSAVFKREVTVRLRPAMRAVTRGITESGSGSVRVDPWDKQFHAVERGEIVKLHVILSASEESHFHLRSKTRSFGLPSG